MMTAGQLRAARALLGIDQKTLADMSGVSLPTIQRMEASDGTVRGVVDTLTKVIEALNRAGVDLIGDNARSEAGVIRSSVGRGESALIVTGCNARNVRAIKADIGQFAIAKLGQFADIALIVPERLDHADEREQHN